MRITTKVFFRKITIRNKELIPKDGPLLIVANHPSTFMDPVVIATILNRELYFLAKGEVFKSKFAKWILPKLNMIPVYRKQDDPSLMSKNDETFIKCYEHLERGGAILLFPEGVSVTERKLRPIKTGASRILLGAETRNNFKLNAQLLIIGLNYEDPHQFNKNLFINIESPINGADFKEKYTQDSFACVEEMTETIRLTLEKLIISINDEQTDKLAHKIELLYKYKLSKDLGLSLKDKEFEFKLTKNIVAAVDYFLQNEPQRAEEISRRITEYLNNIQSLGLTDYNLSTDKHPKSMLNESLKTVFISVVGLPIYLYGLIGNYLPYKFPGWIADATVKQSTFRGAIEMITGTFTFLIFYTLETLLVWNVSHHFFIPILFLASLPITGLLGYSYYYTMSKVRANWLLMMIFYKKSKIVSNLIIEREQLIAEFDKAKNEYIDFVNNTN